MRSALSGDDVPAPWERNTNMKGPRLPRLLEDELAGIDYRWEMGGKHYKLFIGDRMVAIVPKGGFNTSGIRKIINTRAQIRRKLKESA